MPDQHPSISDGEDQADGQAADSSSPEETKETKELRKPWIFLVLILGSAGLVYLARVSLLAADNSTYFRLDESGKIGISALERNWYSSYLRRMEEPSLLVRAGVRGAEEYRFTLLPTWGEPFAVRIFKNGKGFIISYSRLDGDGGYDPGNLVEADTSELPVRQMTEFQNLFAEFSFFAEPSVRGRDSGMDGSQWILEAVKDGRYHAVVRWTADSEPMKRGNMAFLNTCNWMLDHAPRKGKSK